MFIDLAESACISITPWKLKELCQFTYTEPRFYKGGGGDLKEQ